MRAADCNITEDLDTPERDITPKAVTDRQYQDHRRSARKHDHRAGERRGEAEDLHVAGSTRRARAAGDAEHGDRRVSRSIMTRISASITCFTIPAARWPILRYQRGSWAVPISLNGHCGAVSVSNFTGTRLWIARSVRRSERGMALRRTSAPANSLDIIVNALESTGRFHITNRPMVFASQQQEGDYGLRRANPRADQHAFKPNDYRRSVQTAAVQSSIRLQCNCRLQLEVVPLINSDREVNLDIVQKLDSDSGRTENVGGSNCPHHYHPLYPD